MKKIAGMALLVFTVGCSMLTAQKSLIVTGETLRGMGNEFTAVAGQFKQGCDVTKTIKPADCQKFKEFGLQFQKAYPNTVALWEAARSAQDKAATEKMDVVINDLAQQLSDFAMMLLTTYGGK